METTEKLWQLATTELIRSNADLRHPFKTCVLSTAAEFPASRWVIKRKMEEDLSILIYTDSRSPKVSQVVAEEKVSLLFYHPKKKLQVRVVGHAALIDEGSLYETHLEKVKNNPKDYSTLLAPGSKLSSDITHGEDLHFTLIKIIPQSWDILQLGRETHSRAEYKLNGGQWIGEELVP